MALHCSQRLSSSHYYSATIQQIDLSIWAGYPESGEIDI